MSEPKHAKQMSTIFDDTRDVRTSGLQLRENGHDVRGQLAQNAQFKAQMMAQMKARGGAAQRKEEASADQWEAAVNAAIGTGLRVDNAEDACAILRFVWPDEQIKTSYCESSDLKQLAGVVLTQMVDASKTMAELPRVVALSMVTTGWFTKRVITAVLRSGDSAGISLLAVGTVRSVHKAHLRAILQMYGNGVYTTKRGL